MKLFTVKEASEALSCSGSFLYARIADGSLKHYRLGKGQGGIRVSDEQLQEFLKEREKGGEQPSPLRPQDVTYRGP